MSVHLRLVGYEQGSEVRSEFAKILTPTLKRIFEEAWDRQAERDRALLRYEPDKNMDTIGMPYDVFKSLSDEDKCNLVIRHSGFRSERKPDGTVWVNFY